MFLDYLTIINLHSVYIYIYMLHVSKYLIINLSQWILLRMEWSLEFRHMLQMFYIALRIDLNIVFFFYMTITIKKQSRK